VKLNRKITAGLSAAAAAAIFFAWLAYAVKAGTLAWFDLTVRNTIHSWASPVLTRAMRGITQLGSPTFLILLGFLAAWRLAVRKRMRAAIILAVSAIGAEAFDELLKAIFRRPRPEAFFGHSPGSYSFPSGHSVSSCCFYGVLAAIVAVNARSKRETVGVWITAAVITLAVGTSRVYLGVHYPTDVLGGYAAAVVWVALVWIGYRLWIRRAGGRAAGPEPRTPIAGG
jgi:undecaprenyl-diphosphatase